jgi:hypothetical protein
MNPIEKFDKRWNPKRHFRLESCCMSHDAWNRFSDVTYSRMQEDDEDYSIVTVHVYFTRAPNGP